MEEKSKDMGADANAMTQMVGPAMRLMNEITKDIKAGNVVSEFVEKELPQFFDGGNNEMAAGFLVKMMMKEANEQPSQVLRKFLKFYNAFRVFYMGLEKSAEADANPPEEPDDSTAEDTDKE